MQTITKPTITVEAEIHAPVEKVWNNWTNTQAVTKWNSASPDWHTPTAEHDLTPGGKFKYHMEAKDQSMGFDYEGVFDVVTPNKYLESTIADGRKVKTSFIAKGKETHISTVFEAEDTHSIEMQEDGWQAILNNFKSYVESLNDRIELHFEIEINAPVRDVYTTMIDPEQYGVWTGAFCPTSRFEGSWEKGSKILFIGDDDKGEKGGMVASIADNIPGKFISILYEGLLKGDEEITSGEEIDAWKGAYENYTFEEKNGGTLLSIDTVGIKELADFFSQAWPVALNKLKEICEHK